MFKVACEIENKTDEQVTLHLTIPEASEPSVNLVGPNEHVFVFASPSGEPVKITIVKAIGEDK